MFLRRWWVSFETVCVLLSAYEGDDRIHVCRRETFHGGHIAEVPVVLTRTVCNRTPKRVVAMVISLVDQRKMRRPLIGAPQISAMARRA